MLNMKARFALDKGEPQIFARTTMSWYGYIDLHSGIYVNPPDSFQPLRWYIFL